MTLSVLGTLGFTRKLKHSYLEQKQMVTLATTYDSSSSNTDVDLGGKKWISLSG